MAHLSLALLGPFQVKLDGAPITGLESDKVRALLAYLAVEADRPHRRAALAGLLWSERPERAAHLSLNQALSNLRQAIGDRSAPAPVLCITPETIQWNATSDHDLDIATFNDLLAACDQHRHRHPETCTSCARRLQQATALYRGSLLDQFFLRDSAAFEEWALLTRERLHWRAIAALVQLAEYHERRGEYVQAQHSTWRQLELDPWREESHRQLMRVLACSGQRSAALVQYATCRRVLAAELGVAPEEETTALYARIERGEALTDGRATLRTTNVPMHTPLTPFIGREAERAQLADRLEERDCRLLTLIGPGGIGKTRLALQAAADLRASYRDGVCFVALAQLQSVEFVIPAIAGALRFAFHSAVDPKTQLLAYLRAKDLLLVLDNFEHLLVVAPLVSELLAACPDLTVLATSRAPLHVRGEQQFPVPPLALPNLGQLPDVAALAQFSAVSLFVDRAQAIQPTFQLTPVTGPTVATICVRLDGLPLAIELAAARTAILAPEAILTRLSSGLALLTDGARDMPARQQTLRSTIDWSYHLLTAAQQRLFRRLGVFVGGCTVEAAEGVLRTEGRGLSDDTMDSVLSPQSSVLDGLALLVDNSLLRREEVVGGEPRFVMLETIREYALEQLEASGEVALLRQRHARQYGALVAIAEPLLRTSAQEHWLDRLENEHDNIRSALQWCIESGDSAAGLRMGGALWQFWAMRAHLHEGRASLATLLALAEQVAEPDQQARAQALYAWQALAWRSGDYLARRPALEESIVRFRAGGDRWGLARALSDLSDAIAGELDSPRARVLQAESQALFEAIGDPWGIAHALVRQVVVTTLQRATVERALGEEGLRRLRALGDNWSVAIALYELSAAAQCMGDSAWAIQLLEESLVRYRELGDQAGLAEALDELAIEMRFQGQYQRAIQLHDEAAALSEALDLKAYLGRARYGQGMVAYHQGNDQQATALINTSLALFREAQMFFAIGWCFEGLAGVAACTGTAGAQRAARLLAADAVLNNPVLNYPPAKRREWENIVVAVRAQLDEATFAAAWAAGRALPLEQAIAEALDR